jgi:hypothetical protein
MNKILPLGSCLATDSEGFLVFQPSLEKLQPHWHELLNQMVYVYRARYGKNLHGVYVRGTVAKGEAIDGISDLDTFALVREGEEEVQAEWSKEPREALTKKYPFCTGIECIVLPLASLNKIKPPKNINPWKRLIKTQSLCVYGEDLAPTIPPIKPGLEMVAHLFSLGEDLPDEAELATFRKKDCTWLMKRIVRSGFELVMERAQTFSRDLYPCYEHFARYYPEKEAGMKRALELAVFPTDDPTLVRPITENLGRWLAAEGAKWKEELTHPRYQKVSDTNRT